ncbi:MAG: acyl-CoA reductase [Ferruginibacter sp.]
MDIQLRAELLNQLGTYMLSDDSDWQHVINSAYHKNSWFTPEFIELSAQNIANNFLTIDVLQQLINHYHLDNNISPKKIGVVMAGNIPMVGFHDLLCVFISGHKQIIKLSSKDDVLLKHLVEKLYELNSEVKNYITIEESLKNCDAYITTGSNSSAEIFKQYFSKYPNIIRKNRTSVALLNGKEDSHQLFKLSEDIHLFFGKGCRNVTHLYVPENYDFIPLINSFSKFNYFSDHYKYKNNYDFQLSLVLMNKKFYMTNGSTLVLESDSLFPPPSVLYYSYYKDENFINDILINEDVQCVIGTNHIPFGEAQKPQIFNYADGVDTMQFLLTL